MNKTTADWLRYALTDKNGGHVYFSTYCYHRKHDDCRLVCKDCQNPCICDCHEWPQVPPPLTAEQLATAIPCPGGSS
jgi:hypothetical protein